jgi:hypothetical protein
LSIKVIVGSEYVGRRGLVKESCGVTDSGTGMIDTVWWPKVGSVFFLGIRVEQKSVSMPTLKSLDAMRKVETR